MRCKPSSVPRRGGHTAAGRKPFVLTRLCRRALPVRESGLPAIQAAWIGPHRCLALHPVGFAVPGASRRPRCALTAPFHPYPNRKGPGGIFSVALSRSNSVTNHLEQRWALPTTAIQRCSDFPPRLLRRSGLPRIRLQDYNPCGLEIND